MADIKPPYGPSSVDPSAVDGTSSPPESGANERVAGAAFSAQVEAASQQADSVQQDPMADLAAQVQSGQLTKEQAVEQLVERALGDVQGHLTEAQREELTATMRAALADDPTLLALQAQLTE